MTEGSRVVLNVATYRNDSSKLFFAWNVTQQPDSRVVTVIFAQLLQTLFSVLFSRGRLINNTIASLPDLNAWVASEFSGAIPLIMSPLCNLWSLLEATLFAPMLLEEPQVLRNLLDLTIAVTSDRREQTDVGRLSAGVQPERTRRAHCCLYLRGGNYSCCCVATVKAKCTEECVSALW